MEKVAYDNMYSIEERMWWYRGRRAVCHGLLEKHLKEKDLEILDVGCGTGYNMHWLARFGAVQGVDFSEDSIALCHKRGLTTVQQAGANDLPFADEHFDLVTAFDVVEHLDDDTGALREFHRVLKPHGHCLIYTPALPWLYSEHDRIVHHRRRYMKRGLRQTIQDAGLQELHLSYVNLLVLPIVLAARAALALMPHRPHAEMSVPPEPFNAVLTALCRAEVPLVLGPGLPLGMTLVAMVRKGAGAV